MRPLEFNGTIGRTNDFSPMKQAEDARPAVEQQQMMRGEDQRVENEAKQVNEQQDAAKGQFDAKHGSKGSYEEQKEKKRRQKIEEEGIVKIKTSARFDIKI